MPETALQKHAERTPEGQFTKGFSGNPAGRPAGCRNHATRTAETLLDGEADALTRKAVTLALGGDVLALRLCLDLVIAPPRDGPVHFDRPPIESVAKRASEKASIHPFNVVPHAAGGENPRAARRLSTRNCVMSRTSCLPNRTA